MSDKKLSNEELEKVSGGEPDWNAYAGRCPHCKKDFTFGEAKVGGDCAPICPICGACLE